MALAQFVVHRLGIVEGVGEVLREISNRDVAPDDALAGRHRLDAREHLHHGRFAGAIGTDQCDPRATLDHQVDAVIDRQVAVFLDCAFELEDSPRAAFAFREMNRGRLLASGRRFETHDFFELLDARLNQLGLARLVAEAADEGLHVLDFFALIFVGLHLELKALLALHQVARVSADVFGEPAARDLDGLFGDAIEEVAIVRDHDDAAGVRGEIILEPVARLDIEMVGRLVEHHEFGLIEQQLGERDAHPDAAGKFRDIAMQIAFG